VLCSRNDHLKLRYVALTGRGVCVCVCETDDGNMEQLKILADELKILIHIGAHLNILNVLGAVTKDLDNGQKSCPDICATLI